MRDECGVYMQLIDLHVDPAPRPLRLYIILPATKNFVEPQGSSSTYSWSSQPSCQLGTKGTGAKYDKGLIDLCAQSSPWDSWDQNKLPGIPFDLSKIMVVK